MEEIMKNEFIRKNDGIKDGKNIKFWINDGRKDRSSKMLKIMLKKWEKKEWLNFG